MRLHLNIPSTRLRTSVGGHYELTGAESTKYYFAGSTRIAMRKGTTLYYLLGDHLGSTSIVTDAGGEAAF